MNNLPKFQAQGFLWGSVVFSKDGSALSWKVWGVFQWSLTGHFCQRQQEPGVAYTAQSNNEP